MQSTPSATTISTGRPDAARADALLSGWIAQGRDLRLDVLRGFCVLAMIVNHISGGSPLHLLTGGERFHRDRRLHRGHGLPPAGRTRRPCSGHAQGVAAGLEPLPAHGGADFLHRAYLGILRHALGERAGPVAERKVRVERADAPPDLHPGQYPGALYLALCGAARRAAVAIPGARAYAAGRVLAAVAGLPVLPRYCHRPVDRDRRLPVRVLVLAGALLHAAGADLPLGAHP